MVAVENHEPVGGRVRDLSALDGDGLWHAEDLRVGDYMEVGRVEVSRDDIVAYATCFDPLPIHVDGTESPFGDVIASGVQTIAVFSSLASRAFTPRLAVLAGKGIDRLRLPNPVLPGASLSGWVQISDIVMRHDRADVFYQSTLVDDSGRVVLSFVGIVVIARRSPTKAT